MGLFNVFNSNEESKNRSYIKNLLEVAIADGKLDESELNLVISIAEKFDLTKNEVLEIKNNPAEIKFAPPSSYSAKVKLLEDLVNIMIADKQIDEQEVKICKDMALKLNIAPVIVDELIQSSIR
jgi:uncharacterized tellurite resistance protein B-like protein